MAVLDFMQVRILRARYFPAAGDALCDVLTKTALGEGRPAFWSFAPYHRSHFVAAACTANREGLEEACLMIVQILERRGIAVAGAVAAFLHLLTPANLVGERALSHSRRLARTCGNFRSLSLEVL
jgi:hypothetical protein